MEVTFSDAITNDSVGAGNEMMNGYTRDL